MRNLRIISALLYAVFSCEYIYLIWRFMHPDITEIIMDSSNIYSFEYSVFFGFCGLTALAGIGFMVMFLIFSFQKKFGVKKSVILLIWFFTNILAYQLIPIRFFSKFRRTSFWLNSAGQYTLQDISWQNTLQNMAFVFIFVVLLLTALQYDKEKAEKPV